MSKRTPCGCIAAFCSCLKHISDFTEDMDMVSGRNVHKMVIKFMDDRLPLLVSDISLANAKEENAVHQTCFGSLTPSDFSF